MKKILSLVMVVAMLVAVLALVGCNDKKDPNSSSSSSSSSSSTSSSSSSSSDTTSSDTTSSDTTASDTTSSSETTTLPPVFARFDFGTKSKAEDLQLTSHEYLKTALTVEEGFVSVEYTEDSIIVKALKDHPTMSFDESGAEVIPETDAPYQVNSYALQFKNIIDFSYDDLVPANNKYMRIRVKNNTTNNIMSIRFRKATDSETYASTLLASCMYLQGGAPTIEDYIAGENKLTCTASEEYGVYTYDLPFLATLGRNATRAAGSVERYTATSYVHFGYAVGTGHGTGANNWTWSGNNSIASIEFYVLGAYGSSATRPLFAYGDTRANIVEGATVEIDYITFGNSSGDLNKYTSYIQDVYNESVSVSKSISESISKSESEAAAATATTAAAA